MSTMVRLHVLLPEALLAETDRYIGERKRSELIASLLEDWLQRQRQGEAIRALLADPGTPAEDVPEDWKTPEGAAAWVRAQRAGRDHRKMD